MKRLFLVAALRVLSLPSPSHGQAPATYQPVPAAETAPLRAEHGVTRRARLDLAMTAVGVPPGEGEELWSYGMAGQLDLVFPLGTRFSLGARVRGDGRYEQYYEPGALDPSDRFDGLEWTASGLLRVRGQQHWTLMSLGAELGYLHRTRGPTGWLWGVHLLSRVGRVVGATLEMGLLERRFADGVREPELRLSVGISILLGGLR
ncbi:MAG: hypothetical protein AAF447_03315 [Myxococcota bacterium]